MIDFRDSKLYRESFDKSFELLIGAGLNKKDAATLADSFAVSDCFGVQTHGSALIDVYVEKIKHSFFNLNPEFIIEKKTNSFAIINGDNAIGAVSACYCLDYAINCAKKEGVYTIFSKNNNTFGAAFYYSMLSAEKGYICFITSNSPAQMSLPKNNVKILGTNPFSIVFPTKSGYPIIVDMATSAVAKSKIKEYMEKNMVLPDGWALDSKGNPTNNPQEALNGFVLPMAGFKGYAIALSIDIFAGFLSGSSYLNNVGRFLNSNNCMNVGFMMTVYNPKIIFGPDYYEQFDKYINNLKFSNSDEKPVLPGDDRVSFHSKTK